MRAMGQQHLRFVRRGSILLQRGIELRLDPPPPSLGVSSLDLGRRLADGPFFLGAEAYSAGTRLDLDRDVAQAWHVGQAAFVSCRSLRPVGNDRNHRCAVARSDLP